MKPPFRADHVGSLLRPQALKEAREKYAKNEITPSQLKAVEDREIERIIKKQEEAGLEAITDGEFRRSWWHLDFLELGVGKLALAVLGARFVQFAGTQQAADVVGTKWRLHRLPPEDYAAWACFSACALSVASHVKSRSSRPKWP